MSVKMTAAMMCAAFAAGAGAGFVALTPSMLVASHAETMSEQDFMKQAREQRAAGVRMFVDGGL